MNRRNLLLLAFPLLLACNGRSQEDADRLLKSPIVNAGAVLGHTKAEVAKLLGEPTEDRNSACSYKWSEAQEPFGLDVEFVSDRAVCISAWLIRPMHSPEAAVKLFGVDVTQQPPAKEAVGGRWWQGQFGDVSYSRIGSVKGDPNGEEWSFVKAEQKADSSLL